MKVYDFFTLCEREFPGKRTLLRGTSFALRRAMVDTMETLCEMKYRQPERLAHLRDIGPKSLSMIDEVVRLFELTQTAEQSANNDS